MATITPYITGMEDGADYEGSTCVRDYLVDGTINPGDLPVIGQPYLSQPDWPGSNFVVKSYGRVARVRQPSGGGVTLDVIRVNGSTNGVTMLTDSMVDLVEKGMEAGESFQVSPEHIGARQAEGQDCGEWEDPETGKMRKYLLSESIPLGTSIDSDTAVASQNASAVLYAPLPGGTTFAYRGGYVYVNACARAAYGDANAARSKTVDGVTEDQTRRRRWFYLARAASSGSAQLQHCPFTVLGAPTTTELTLYMIGRSFICATYQMAYYQRTDQYYMTHAPQYPNNGRVLDWGPVIGKKYGPPVASPPPATDGQWRITAQSVTGMRDTDGSHLLKISRTFQRVPYAFPNCIWNPNIYPAWSADWP